ncbi:MAG: dephospho-CoA kinase [Bacteroidia bacterium]|nr:dephospho-CoA kinase [Bacteroidia bacterium]
MIKIGVTGGIGSGKSTVCEIFESLKIPVFHADLEARRLQNRDSLIKSQITELLGADCYNQEGLMDRKLVASRIFTDKALLTQMNQIIHPAVREEFHSWILGYPEAPYVIYEAAILFESNTAADFDQIILVVADQDIRINRVIARDQVDKEQVMIRMANQMLDQEKIKLADCVIDNNEVELLYPQILKIDKSIKENGKIR